MISYETSLGEYVIFDQRELRVRPLVLHKGILEKSYKKTAKLLLLEGLIIVAGQINIVLGGGYHENTDIWNSV